MATLQSHEIGRHMRRGAFGNPTDGADNTEKNTIQQLAHAIIQQVYIYCSARTSTAGCIERRLS